MEWSRFYLRRRKFHPKKSDPIDSSRCKFNILSSQSHDFHIELVGTRMPVALVHQSNIDLPGGHICNKLSFGLLDLLEPCLVRILDVNGVMGTTRVPEACVMHDPKWSQAITLPLVWFKHWNSSEKFSLKWLILAVSLVPHIAQTSQQGAEKTFLSSLRYFSEGKDSPELLDQELHSHSPETLPDVKHPGCEGTEQLCARYIISPLNWGGRKRWMGSNGNSC